MSSASLDGLVWRETTKQKEQNQEVTSPYKDMWEKKHNPERTRSPSTLCGVPWYPLLMTLQRWSVHVMHLYGLHHCPLLCYRPLSPHLSLVSSHWHRGPLEAPLKPPSSPLQALNSQTFSLNLDFIFKFHPPASIHRPSVSIYASSLDSTPLPCFTDLQSQSRLHQIPTHLPCFTDLQFQPRLHL